MKKINILASGLFSFASLINPILAKDIEIIKTDVEKTLVPSHLIKCEELIIGKKTEKGCHLGMYQSDGIYYYIIDGSSKPSKLGTYEDARLFLRYNLKDGKTIQWSKKIKSILSSLPKLPESLPDDDHEWEKNLIVNKWSA